MYALRKVMDLNVLPLLHSSLSGRSQTPWNQARPNMAKPCTKLRKQQAPVTPMRQNYEDRTSGDDTDTRASTPSISSSNLTPSKILFFVLSKFERKITTEIRA